MKRTMHPSSEAGVTLIELMIAVAIIAILATVSVVGFGKYLKNARVVEARELMGRIQMAQESFFARTGAYCSASQNTWHPPFVPDFEARDWGTPPPTWANCFGNRLKPENNKTYFSYLVVAGTNTLDAVGTSLGIAAGAPWYYVVAQADMDGDPATQPMQLRTTSQRRQVWTVNEGQ